MPRARQRKLTADPYARRIEQLDRFLAKHFPGEDFDGTCLALGLIVSRLVCRYDWTADMIETLFAEQVQLIRDEHGRKCACSDKRKASKAN